MELSEPTTPDTPPDTAEPGSPGPLLNRNFLLLWSGQTISQLGNQAFSIAMMFWTMEAMQGGGMSPATRTVIGLLFGVAVLLGVIRAYFLPAVSATIPRLVPKEKLAGANSLNQLSIQGSIFVACVMLFRRGVVGEIAHFLRIRL